MQQNQIDNKIRAARELGLTVVEEYKTIDGNNYAVLNIKKDDIVIEKFLHLLNKPLALQQLENQKNTLTAALADIENKITQINELE